MSVLCNHTVFHGQQTFGIFGCRSQKRCNPHPEQCSGAACHKRRCHTYNVTGSDGCGKSGTKCAKAGHLSMLSGLFVVFDVLNAHGHFRDLQTL